ncbi:ABC transporter ATP-binding protein [Anaplasma phagocytophilum]|uniref:Cell division ATP-binding protein FtsE n=1 Tax=Anaplasma phagocytophilum str. CRT53-1 TaxID=1359157 RepID=A0A0F3Q7Q5_ANAPH|nr:ABC transporter ATP-binding protein [Anaplasma phagocytophilum]KDB57582.1 ABC transporter [Anaplasma phagocytophilum str. CRT35]KJV88600.1 ABC transporter family protein [Anaplasma phagocytophilum str. CRT53-1]SCV63641.1 Lipoprotein-releasing system ATP-binding protein LolD [Anaplasma phagocytophilum]
MSTVLKLCNVSKRYSEQQNCVFSDVNLEIFKGEFVALIGNSGAGKSTLLHIAGLLEVPSQGKVIINNVQCSPESDKVRTKMRRSFLGFVYQSPNLLHELTVLENVMLPLRIAGNSFSQAKHQAMVTLCEVGLEGKVNQHISTLSGGEKQRVAFARAIVNHPNLLLADEPTGSLDPQMSETIFSIMYQNVKSKNLAALVATHNLALAKKADAVIELRNGILSKVDL